MQRFLSSAACVMALGWVVCGPEVSEAAPAASLPTEAEVAEMLKTEPISVRTWPTWRERVLAWMGDRSGATNAAFEAAAEIVHSQSKGDAELPAELEQDPLAWYLLGRSHMYRPGIEPKKRGELAEAALRQSIAIDPTFARAHRNLGIALLMQETAGANTSRTAEAQAELERARQLDPTLKMKGALAQAALERRDVPQAERLFLEAQAEEPGEISNVLGYAMSVVLNRERQGPRGAIIAPLVEKHPDNGILACIYGLALAVDDQPKEAVRQFERARQLGTDPASMFSPELVHSVEAAAQPGLLEILAIVLVAFVLFYAVVLACMAIAGLFLAGLTRGRGALTLLSDQPLEMVPGGQIVRAQRETWLALMYAVALVCGLVLFYVSLPFIMAGIIASTMGLLWLIFQAGRIPVKLVLVILIVGFGMAWAVLKSMFARSGTATFGLTKSEEQCPKLYDALRDVAGRVDTEPIHDVCIAPGSEIGVHQEGRGPFGMFGTKKRVLTLGLATLHSLTVDELKSILAHEYAHFSHQDTFYSRFIHRVDVSIHTALSGMGAAGGKLNYINPFFWFLVLYYRTYSLLSAGYSRSREYLADRMACSLYGSNVFSSALTKVCTEGPLFDSTMYPSIGHLLGEQKSYVNMYEVFGKLKGNQDSAEQRQAIRQSLADSKSSLFSSHPTWKERLDAATEWPAAHHPNETPAMQLFENPEELERELTDFVTHVIQSARAHG